MQLEKEIEIEDVNISSNTVYYGNNYKYIFFFSTQTKIFICYEQNSTKQINLCEIDPNSLVTLRSQSLPYTLYSFNALFIIDNILYGTKDQKSPTTFNLIYNIEE